MAEVYTTKVVKYDPQDPRLGRHVRHDSRSKNFQINASPLSSLVSTKWERKTPILDQGQLGSCTGNAGVGCLGTEPFFDTVPNTVTLNEDLAVKYYSEATVLDSFPGSYPPQDTGSDGLSIAKVLKNHGLISGYLHAMSLEAALTALSIRPVIVGTEWLEGMFNPAPDGRLVLTGQVAGGHEYEINELDVENQRVWIDNSWGESWGIQGRAYLTWDDFGTLLDNDGDVTFFVPNVEAPPTPTPPAPPAPPAPPQPDPTAKFKGAYENFRTAADEFFGS